MREAIGQGWGFTAAKVSRCRIVSLQAQVGYGVNYQNIMGKGEDGKKVVVAVDSPPGIYTAASIIIIIIIPIIINHVYPGLGTRWL